MSNIQTLNTLYESKIVAILRNVDEKKIDNVVKALIGGGIKCIEITMGSSGTLEQIKNIKRKYKDSVSIGAGTVLDAAACRMAIEAGAEYIVTPTVNKDVIKMSNMYGKPCIPGAMTPTEILTAYEYGASMIKVFPATTLGTSFFREISGPLGFIPLMATGGINIENIDSYIKVGVKAFGMGSSLISKQAVETDDYEKIREDAAKIITMVSK